jgi:hypothetical protein
MKRGAAEEPPLKLLERPRTIKRLEPFQRENYLFLLKPHASPAKLPSKPRSRVTITAFGYSVYQVVWRSTGRRLAIVFCSEYPRKMHATGRSFSVSPSTGPTKFWSIQAPVLG